jgi:hypothetical protein
LHVACNCHYLGWVLTWKYLKQGFWGKILVFGWKITDFENCVLLHRDGGIIDHIYIRGLHSVQSGVLPVYYSDHAAIYSILQ